MRRVAVIGSGGAGKSTFALELDRITGLPVTHLDRLYWHPGWVETPREEWAARVGELVRADEWILDGNYSATLSVRLAVADTVIYLDFPTWLCLWRVLCRRIAYRRRVRPDIAEGCRETVDWVFLRWIVTFRRRNRQALLAALEGRRDTLAAVILRNPGEAKRYLDCLRR